MSVSYLITVWHFMCHGFTAAQPTWTPKIDNFYETKDLYLVSQALQVKSVTNKGSLPI